MKLFLRLGGFMKQKGCLATRLLRDLEQTNLPVEVWEASPYNARPELFTGETYPRDKLAEGLKDIEQVAADLAKRPLADVIKQHRSKFFPLLREEPPAVQPKASS